MRTPAEIDEAEAGLLTRRAELLRALAELEIAIEAVRGERRLQRREQSVTDQGMVSAARAHISAGRSASENKGKADPLVLAASAKGHTMRSLAQLIEAETGRKTPASIISRARRGTRRIRLTAARVIEKATKFRAIAGNWPGGWASEDED